MKDVKLVQSDPSTGRNIYTEIRSVQLFSKDGTKSMLLRVEHLNALELAELLKKSVEFFEKVPDIYTTKEPTK